MTEQREFLPAMGSHGSLIFYAPLTRLAGLPRVHTELLDRAGVRPDHRVLEIGCGPGDLLFSLARRVPGVDAAGIDPDPAALRLARRKATRRRLPVRFELAYADALPAGDASLDRVLSSYMLHHLDDDQKLQAMREIRRVLRPGGELHVVDAYGGSHGRTRLTRQTPEAVLDLMRAAGLDPAENGRNHRRGPIGHYAFYRAVVSQPGC